MMFLNSLNVSFKHNDLIHMGSKFYLDAISNANEPVLDCAYCVQCPRL